MRNDHLSLKPANPLCALRCGALWFRTESFTTPFLYPVQKSNGNMASENATFSGVLCVRWEYFFPLSYSLTGVRASPESAEVGGLGREAQTVPRWRNLPRAERVSFLHRRPEIALASKRCHVVISNVFLPRKGAFKAGVETTLTGVVSYPYPTSNRSSNPALKWVL